MMQALALFLCLLATPVWALELFTVDRGNYRYLHDDFEGARALYEKSGKESPSATLHYNLGDTYYRLGRYEEARQEFEKALSATDAHLREASLYNLGNTLYRENKLEDSIAAYDKVLAANPDNEKARLNRDFVARKLKEQQQQQQNQQENQQKEQEQQPQENQADGKNENNGNDGKNEEQGKEEQEQPDQKQPDQKQPDQEQPEPKPESDKSDKSDKSESEQSDRSEKSDKSDKVSPKQAEQLLQSVEDDPKKALQERFMRETSVPPPKNPKDW